MNGPTLCHNASPRHLRRRLARGRGICLQRRLESRAYGSGAARARAAQGLDLLCRLGKQVVHTGILQCQTACDGAVLGHARERYTPCDALEEQGTSRKGRRRRSRKVQRGREAEIEVLGEGHVAQIRCGFVRGCANGPCQRAVGGDAGVEGRRADEGVRRLAQRAAGRRAVKHVTANNLRGDVMVREDGHAYRQSPGIVPGRSSTGEHHLDDGDGGGDGGVEW